MFCFYKYNGVFRFTKFMGRNKVFDWFLNRCGQQYLNFLHLSVVCGLCLLQLLAEIIDSTLLPQPPPPKINKQGCLQRRFFHLHWYNFFNLYCVVLKQV